ncbi:MAG: YgfZ/GcvT domain-containing protein [Opitutales bacterium]
MDLNLYPYDVSAHLEVCGEDAAEFLQSQFSNDLRPFSKGQCTYGLWLDVKGKLLADSWVLCEGEGQFRIFSEFCRGELIQDTLEKHIIADDVELELNRSTAALALIGENVNQVEVGASVLAAFPGRRGDLASRELVFSDEASRSAWIDANGGEVVSENWIQSERMAAGVSIVGCEVMPGDMPAEGGLVEDAVSFTKGCFLGQEVVARLHNLGKPQRGLYLLRGPNGPASMPCPLMNEQGKTLGEMRSWLATGQELEGMGVAMLKSRHLTKGMKLSADSMNFKVEKPYSKTFKIE